MGRPLSVDLQKAIYLVTSISSIKQKLKIALILFQNSFDVYNAAGANVSQT